MKLKRFLPSKERTLVAFVLIVRLSLGFMFIVSSVPKIGRPYVFLGSVYGYGLVGRDLGVLVAVALPWLELLTGACLIGGVFAEDVPVVVGSS
jgi:uncharacterized membrane protein YphA (DoxX/SURF4 family)